jgi:hypothetical protein
MIVGLVYNYCILRNNQSLLLDGMGANLPASRPVTSACSFSSSFGDCVASLLLPNCPSLAILSFASACSYTSSASPWSSTMYSPSDFRFRLLFLILFLFRRLRRCHCCFLFVYRLLFFFRFRLLLHFIAKLIVVNNVFVQSLPLALSLPLTDTALLPNPLCLSLAFFRFRFRFCLSYTLAHRRLQCIHNQIELLLGFT